jgi:hypothetical protein
LHLKGSSSDGEDILASGKSLQINERITSTNGRFFAIMQEDGNFCVYQNPDGIQNNVWSTGTQGLGAVRIDMQSDGFLVLRDTNGKHTWFTGSTDNGGAYAKM